MGGRHTCHKDRGGNRQHQRRDLCDQTVTDGQKYIDLGGVAKGQAELACADDDATDDVGDQNKDTGDRVALHKFRRTVHRTVEVRLFRDV